MTSVLLTVHPPQIRDPVERAHLRRNRPRSTPSRLQGVRLEGLPRARRSKVGVRLGPCRRKSGEAAPRACLPPVVDLRSGGGGGAMASTGAVAPDPAPTDGNRT